MRAPGGLTRILLHLYSPTFRRRYGAEALDTLLRDLEEARARGGWKGPLRRLAVVAAFALHGLLDRLDRVRAFLAEEGAGLRYGWGQDVRLALRSTSRRLGLTLVAVASLAVGVGANGVVFAVVDTFLLRDIPGAGDPDRIVQLYQLQREGGPSGWSWPDFMDVAREVGGLEAAALVERGPVSLAENGAGRQVLALYVTSGYFRSVGVTPALGRDFTPAVDREAGVHTEVILAHETWRDRFEADPAILGRTVRLNRRPYTVVGVVPESWRGHQFALHPAVYLPLTQYPPAVRNPERFMDSRSTLWAQAVGRMGPDTDLDQLNAALRTVMARLEEAYPESNPGRSARAVPAALLPGEGRMVASVAFGLIGGLMLLVLAAASANVGGMLLARASARQREMAVRRALGSGRARIVRHLVTEAGVVFTLGGAAGVFLATRGLAWFEGGAFLPTFLPFDLAFELDVRILAAMVFLTAVVGLVFGLIPAVSASRESITEGFREGAGNPRASRLRRVFVAGQVGVSITLLAGAAVFLRSLQAGGDIPTGFTPEGVYMTGFDLSLEGYEDPDDGAVLVDRLLERVRALPDVSGATIAGDFPLDGASSSAPVWPDGRTDDGEGWIRAHYARVSDGYFETLEIPLTAGRTFGPDDGRTTRPVAVVNRFLAEAAWPGQDPVGRTLEFGLRPRVYEVVGVVGDTRTSTVTDPPTAQVFTLVTQDFEPDLMLAVRRRGASPDFVRRLREGVLSVDPALALSPTRSLGALAALGMLPYRLVTSIAGTLGALALLLSALGVYGVIAFSVTRRTREIGVRMALGSSRALVLREVLVDGLKLALPGFLVGLPVAMALAVALRGLLVGVSPLDPLTYAGVAALFLGVVAGASLIPARRASRVQPAEALRYD